jgi:hypothetical protein
VPHFVRKHPCERYTALMRLVVCSLALALFACGKSMSRSDAADAAGAGGTQAGNGGDAPTTSGVGGQSAEGGASAGGSIGGASGGRASGGAAGSSAGAGGTGGNGAGPSAGVGGNSAGSAGAAGAPDLGCDGAYDVCGCGCCGEAMSAGCYYPERGDDLATIRADDQAAAMHPRCATEGCSLGVRLLCCETTGVEDSATYALSGWSSDLQYTVVARTTDDGRCTGAVFARPRIPGRGAFPFELPDQWNFEYAYAQDGGCDANLPSEELVTIGGLGFLKFTDPNCIFVFDFDFTLFFRGEADSVEAVRFKADGVRFPIHGDTCI